MGMQFQQMRGSQVSQWQLIMEEEEIGDNENDQGDDGNDDDGQWHGQKRVEWMMMTR